MVALTGTPHPMNLAWQRHVANQCPKTI